MPAQNAEPAPVSTTTRTRCIHAELFDVSRSSCDKAPRSAFRLSGRFRVKNRNRSSVFPDERDLCSSDENPLRDRSAHPSRCRNQELEQYRAERLALGIDSQRSARATRQGVSIDEIERVQIRAAHSA